ncbi:MAG: cytochrome C oxidase subunit III [Deltaproteobacteria bacterium HGW-Deltaproteobacteria-8]|jgi:cytochrome c oxidase subunit 3|nr:MAG: cytochrome C oxidase subunit III [Deltaproteobacteria bacterium HGW-Deltaproteobacteria-8]
MAEHIAAATPLGGHPKDYHAAKMGMWLFLFTEILLFGGLFLLYASYRHKFPQAFHAGGQTLDVFLGGLNTVVLITSSLSVALSITALRRGELTRCLWLLSFTIACAGAFMVNKTIEWMAKFHHGLIPGSEHMLGLPQGQSIFYGLYFAMTGLHGIHVIIGASVLAWVMLLIRQGKVTAEDYVVLENAGLYWHIVDLVWIYLFPLFYLIS